MTNPYQPSIPLSYQSPAHIPHSGMGIASFVLAIGSGALELVVVVIAGIMASRPGGMDEKSPESMLVGVFVCGGLLPILTGIGLGIACLFQAQRRKIFGILGLCFNVLIILALGALMILGLTVKA